jgi:hypothetical protein
LIRRACQVQFNAVAMIVSSSEHLIHCGIC